MERPAQCLLYLGIGDHAAADKSGGSEAIFAAGDVVHGSKTVVHAVEQAKKAAVAMIAYMEKES